MLQFRADSGYRERPLTTHIDRPSLSERTVAAARSGLGRIIVDGRGRTLYLFEKDKRGG